MNIKIAASIACGVLACATAHAQEAAPTTQVSVGVKVWNAAWSSYLPAATAGVNASGQPAIGSTVDSVEGKRRTNTIPLIAVRRGQYFVSGSYGDYSSDFRVATTTVTIGPATSLITSRSDHFTRQESDFTAGYFVTPEIALTLGLKYAKESRDIALGIAPQSTPLLETKVYGALVGFIASFPVSGALRLYTQAGYGPAHYKSTFADPATASASGNGSYFIGEIGVSYPLYAAHGNFPALSSALGYRTQTVKSDSDGSVFNETRKLRDVRDGLVVSLTATF